jgi:YrbI family 3-deoxy-D-manno-octulosonate 8-phosphate phosphatase
MKLKKIKLLVSDVDGVLTDGGMYYSAEGELMKKFHTRDGMGVELLLTKNIKTVLLSKENSKIVTKRAKKIKVTKSYIGVLQKEILLEKLCRDFQVNLMEIAYIGDDVNDLEIMKKVGFSGTPKDGVAQIKQIADYVCNVKGGYGVLREIADLIIEANNSNKSLA